MEDLKRLLKTDIIKLKSTGLLWLHLCVPLLGLMVFLGYYSYTPWTDFSKISAYLQVLCMTFPILIGIITSIIAEQEYMAGGFQNILISSEIKFLSFISIYIVVLVLGILSTILSVVGFYIGFSHIGNNIFSFNIYLSVICILIGSNLFEYIFHFFLSFRFSKGISIGVGIVESLISALFLTGMGDGRWQFFPCAWSIRFINSLLIKYENFNNYVDPSLNLGIKIAFVGTIMAFIMVLMWFTKWEGNKAEE